MSTLDKLLPARRTPWASAASRASLERFLAQAAKADWDAKLDRLGETKKILAMAPASQAEIVDLAVAYVEALMRSCSSNGLLILDDASSARASRSKSLVSKLVARPLRWQPATLVRLVEGVLFHGHWLPGLGILRAIDKALDGAPVPPALRTALEKLRADLLQVESTDRRELARRIDNVLAGGPPPAPEVSTIHEVDAWTIALAAHRRLATKHQDAIAALLVHAARATTAKPGKAWLARAGELVAALGRPAHVALLRAILPAVGTAAPFRVDVPVYDTEHGERHDGDPTLVSALHADLLRGLVWSAIAGDAEAVVTLIGDCAERCFKKLRGHGPLAPKIGNACLQALSHAPSDRAVGQLGRLKVRAKHASVRTLLDRAVIGAGERTGLSPAELEEVGVPTCGLDEIGRAVVVLGAITGELCIGGDEGVELTWRDRKGQAVTAPKRLAGKLGERLAALRKAQAELAGVVPAQRVRLERMLMGGRTVPYSSWRERYADHVLVGALARRLIWWCGEGRAARLVAFAGERLVDVTGERVVPEKDARMWLWHPVQSAASVVRAWRGWLARHEIRQPFKQAHREIYLLTDAERATRTYSNRFAAHVLRQHQLAALCALRGWRYHLQGDWDSHNTPVLELAEHGWRVELHVDAPPDAFTSAAGIYLFVGTGRVAFYASGDETPAPLEEVPRMVFTECMREVDLFVGVASVGNDPRWQESGEGHRAYWQSYAFGDPGEAGRSRHDALERLLPRLAIGKRCTLGERFLTVRGQLRTYHIHLGSAAVQMDPNSQYLCIVPGRKGGKPIDAGVTLPFDGDRTLSVILSKAFLLAADDRIRDHGIRTQIEAS